MSPFFESLSGADNAITLAVNGCFSPLTDHLWIIMSHKAIWVPLYVLIIALLFSKLGWKRGLVSLLGIALALLLCDRFSTIVKELTDRLRPCHDNWMLEQGLRVLERKGSLFGFFSAHSANAMCLASVSSRFLALSARLALTRWFGSLIFIWALLVSVSRIFVGKHFFGDVVVGIVVGLLAGWLIFRLLKPLALRVSR